MNKNMKMKMNKFDQKKYILEYKKNHKKQFKVDLNIQEYIELKELLKMHNLTNVQFVRNAILDLKNIEKKVNR